MTGVPEHDVPRDLPLAEPVAEPVRVKLKRKRGRTFGLNRFLGDRSELSITLANLRARLASVTRPSQPPGPTTPTFWSLGTTLGGNLLPRDPGF